MKASSSIFSHSVFQDGNLKANINASKRPNAPTGAVGLALRDVINSLTLSAS